MFRAARKLADHNPAAMAGWYVRQLSSSVLIVFLLHEGFNTFSSHVGRRRKMLHTFLFEFMYGFLSALLLGIFSGTFSNCELFVFYLSCFSLV